MRASSLQPAAGQPSVQLDLPQPVLGMDISLGKEEAVAVLSVDVGRAPSVADNLHRRFEATQLEFTLTWGKGRLRRCQQPSSNISTDRASTIKAIVAIGMAISPNPT